MCASFGCGPKPTYNFCAEVVRICGIYTITIVACSVQRAACSSIIIIIITRRRSSQEEFS
jgi:hypothetical protein